MGKHTYYIAIIGDNSLEGEIELTRSELDVFYKIVGSLKPDGKYVPKIIVRDLPREAAEFELEKRRKEIEERRREEQFREECSHLGKYSVGDKFREAFAEKGWVVCKR